jgi:hypothetical protein
VPASRLATFHARPIQSWSFTSRFGEGFVGFPWGVSFCNCWILGEHFNQFKPTIKEIIQRKLGLHWSSRRCIPNSLSGAHKGGILFHVNLLSPGTSPSFYIGIQLIICFHRAGMKWFQERRQWWGCTKLWWQFSSAACIWSRQKHCHLVLDSIKNISLMRIYWVLLMKDDEFRQKAAMNFFRAHGQFHVP